MSLGGDHMSQTQPNPEESNGRSNQPPAQPDPMYHHQQQYGGYQPPPGPIGPPHQNVMHPPDQVQDHILT